MLEPPKKRHYPVPHQHVPKDAPFQPLSEVYEKTDFYSTSSVGRVFIIYNKFYPEYFYIGRSYRPIKTLISYFLSYMYGYIRLTIQILLAKNSFKGKPEDAEERGYYLKNFLQIILNFGSNHLHVKILDHDPNPFLLERKYEWWRTHLNAWCYDKLNQISHINEIEKHVVYEVSEHNLKYTIERKKVKFHSSAQCYVIHHVDGRPPQRIYHLMDFCKENRLHYETLRRTRSPFKNNYRRHHKGFFMRDEFVR